MITIDDIPLSSLLEKLPEQVSSVINYWFSLQERYNENWFNGSVDLEICEKFESLLHLAENGNLDSWKENSISCLALIIILDQFSRNIYRSAIDQYRNGNDQENQQIQSLVNNDMKALQLANHLLIDRFDLKLPLVMRIFILLPFRHSRTTTNLDFALNIVKSYYLEFTKKEDLSILNRFFNATLRDYSRVFDTVQLFNNSVTVSVTNYPDLDQLVLDEKCLSYSQNSEIYNYQHSLRKDKLFIQIEKWVKTYISSTQKSICVSLSGGVDSMVLLYIFHQMRLEKKISQIYAVHIDYANREVSRQEAEFVVKWCEFLQIPLYLRRIEHIQRNEKIGDRKIDRKVYEEETKRIRFALYHHVLKLHPDVFGVCLGHHEGDLVENVLMNIFRNSDILDLNKMKDVNTIDNVRICRPMLGLDKSFVYAVSEKFSIPYLKNTTCETCCRGILREQILPQIEKISDSFSGILAIGQASEAWSAVVDSMIVEPILNSVIDSKIGFYLTVPQSLFTAPQILWEKIFSRIFNARKLYMISRKCLVSLREFLTNLKEEKLFNMSNGCLANMRVKRMRDEEKREKKERGQIGERVEKQEKMIYFIYSKFINIVRETKVTLNKNDKIKIGQFTIEVEETDSYIKDKNDLTSLFNNKLVYTLPYTREFLIKSVLERNSSTRGKIRDLGKLSKYIPKLEKIDGRDCDGWIRVTIRI